MIAPIDQYLSIDPIVAGQGRFLTVQPPNPVQQVLVRSVGVDDRGVVIPMIADTDSDGSRTVIPIDRGHQFQRMADALSERNDAG